MGTHSFCRRRYCRSCRYIHHPDPLQHQQIPAWPRARRSPPPQPLRPDPQRGKHRGPCRPGARPPPRPGWHGTKARAVLHSRFVACRRRAQLLEQIVDHGAGGLVAVLSGRPSFLAPGWWRIPEGGGKRERIKKDELIIGKDACL